MRCRCFLLALVLPAIFTLPAPAGIIFGRRAKPNPMERVPQLLVTVKTDSDDDKRASAAKELRDYDPATFPELVSVLVDVSQHDPKTGVRLEAVQSLAKLRPVSQEAGVALEEATRDASIRVRWQARSSLLSYRLAGYRSGAKETEPPLAVPAKSMPVVTSTPSGPAQKQTVEPPIARTTSGVATSETPPPPLAQPLPKGPAEEPKAAKATAPPPLAPAEEPKLQTPPAQPSSEAGPDLPPQE